VEAHIEHALGFAEAIAPERGESGPTFERAADLGSGGGVPALVLALRFEGTEWSLVEAASRRAAFLRGAVATLGLDHRAVVVEERAEVVGRAPADRGRFDLVVVRSFGPPAVVAECAAPLLRVGGRAVVSEPPGGTPGRWPADGLAPLGLVPGDAVVAAGASYQVLRQERECPERWPRRVGIPAKRPLF
jgi:16S rRNA (guanine527-N7)-methyltransferase